LSENVSMNEGLMLKPIEQTRLATLNLILEKELSVKEASLILKLSERHAWRLLRSYRKEGIRAVAHGNRGLTAYNATSKELRDRIVWLARTRYPGLNHTHLTEMLIEKEGDFTLTIHSAQHTDRRRLAQSPAAPAS
jgi:hypothetical protein